LFILTIMKKKFDKNKLGKKIVGFGIITIPIPLFPSSLFIAPGAYLMGLKNFMRYYKKNKLKQKKT